MSKKLLIAAGVLLVLIVAAVSYFASNLDSIVQKAIEAIGPQMTGVSVKVKSVAIALKDGRGEIGGLVIGSPKGYQEAHSIRMGSITLALDPATAKQDVVVIRELVIEAPDLVYEKGPGGSNVEVIQKNVDDYVKARFGGAPPSSEKAKKGDAGAETRFIVEHLQIRNGKVHVAGVAGKDADVALPPVSLRDVGKSRGGMTGGEIASVVVKEMTEGIVATAARALAKEGVKRGVEGAKDKILGR